MYIYIYMYIIIDRWIERERERERERKRGPMPTSYTPSDDTYLRHWRGWRVSAGERENER